MSRLLALGHCPTTQDTSNYTTEGEMMAKARNSASPPQCAWIPLPLPVLTPGIGLRTRLRTFGRDRKTPRGFERPSPASKPSESERFGWTIWSIGNDAALHAGSVGGISVLAARGPQTARSANALRAPSMRRVPSAAPNPVRNRVRPCESASARSRTPGPSRGRHPVLRETCRAPSPTGFRSDRASRT